MRTFRFTVVMAGLVSLWACSGGSDGPPAAPGPSPALYPVAADGYEGATGDDTSATASALAVGSPQYRTLFPDFDVDWVKFELVPGTTYELSANHLSTASDLYVRLYGTDATTQFAYDSNDDPDDYISLDPHLVFTVATAGTYYAKVSSFDARNGFGPAQASYTLSLHAFADADGDDVSSYYDCDDANSTISPFELDVAGDGIDQDCDGIDALVASVADAFEPDDDAAHARPLAAPVGNPWEYMFEHAMVRANARTLDALGDQDWFSLSVPAMSRVYLEELDYTSNGALTVFDAADLSTVDAPSAGFYAVVDNTTASAKSYYARFVCTSGSAFYVPLQYPAGVDLDGDGYYTQDWDGDRDCNDADPAIHPLASETPADGVDSNCNGFDGT